MLRMCNVKIEYKKFVSHKNEFFLWHVITFLLLRDNRNISSRHSILNNVQKKKNFCYTKNNFVSKQKVLCAQKVMRSQPNQVDVAQKSVLRQQKKLLLRQKNNTCRQKQDEKKILCAEKSY